MDLPSLKDISNDELLINTEAIRKRECREIALMVLHLAEIDSRQLYRDVGYASLFAYCMSLKYSESAAQRRIVAARCLKTNPELYGMLKNGAISFSVIGEMAKVITTENKTEVLDLFQGNSTRKAQKLAVELGAPEAPAREIVRARKVVPASSPDESPPAAEVRFSLKFEVDQEFMDLVEEAKSYGNMGAISEVLKRALKADLERRRPKPKTVKTAIVVTPAPKKPSRYIPRAVRDEVRLRDGNRCTYCAPNGKRCEAMTRLQFDHVIPFALGGSASVENLTLKCSAHNALAAETVFGREYVIQRRSAKGCEI